MSDDSNINNRTPDKEQDLLAETIAIYNKSLLSRKDAEFNFRLICEWLGKHSSDDPEGMTQEQREACVKEGDVLLGRLKLSVMELKKMDAQYEDLRKRVNKYYGKELLKEHPKIDYEKMLRGEEDDESDWWKK